MIPKGPASISPSTCIIKLVEVGRDYGNLSPKVVHLPWMLIPAGNWRM